MLKPVLLCAWTIFSAVLLINTNARGAFKKPIKDTAVARAIYPSYNTSPKAPDITGMGNTAVQQAALIKIGWNIGNTMEAPGSETGWGNPLITEDYIKFIKQIGFNAIRIPCAWDQYADKKSAKIQDAWLNRVKQVVGYCVKNDMYVLLNIHWDGGWLENNCTPVKKDAVNAKQRAYWEQIATVMRDFDGHLMFASANEPAITDASQMSVLLSYHQTFVNAVRATGGRNTYRVLVVQGPSTDIKKTNDLMSGLPADQVADRLMVEVHYYSPFNFCIMEKDQSWGRMFYYWGSGHHSLSDTSRNPTYGEEAEVRNAFQLMKTKYVDRGIPVLMGEYGAYRRTTPKDLTTHNEAVDYWIKFTTQQAIANGLKPFFWDIGVAIDRRNNKTLDQPTIDALMAGSH
ncbi:glycoside hydrolase family 5 protein [Mucilaginibacter sabulilitoris]|uniref:Glycoside hydrolase family 5 protein n=1 Tax=Mucilaginibacter sabulilitoris TaxID=1173583 RepID=A0ABZ0TPN0_9SPHI|nr:glycoside hydrolase family 5 protein [Mucilaginibacter sabulilitoris]WPU94857.1 glycoside hydrolase family 5 protein [Mucilaginibacter sabulilitoris]